jgi:hypothetical protein
MFDSNGRPKLAADTLLYYTKTKWATNFDAIVDGNDPIIFNAFHGNYKIEAEFDGVLKEFSVPLLKANADSIFILNETDARVKGPQLLNAELIELGAISLVFDKPINSKLLRRSDFKFFAPGNIGITSAHVDMENENNLILSLSRDVTPGNYLSVSYFPGSLVSVDGGIASPFGPVSVPNLVSDPPVSVNIVNKNSIKIYPNPATDNINIEFESSQFTFHIYNSNGILVHSGKSDEESINIDVGSFGRGIYFLRLTDAGNVMYVEKFIVK